MTRGRKPVIQLLDVVLLFFAYFVTIQVRSRSNLYFFYDQLSYSLPQVYNGFILFFAPFYLLLLYIFGFYEDRIKTNFFLLAVRHLIVSLFLFTAITAVSSFFRLTEIPRSITVSYIFFNFFLMIICRIFIQTLGKKKVFRTVVIGDPRESTTILKLLRKFKNFRIQILGIITYAGKEKRVYIYPVLGKLTKLTEIFSKNPCDLILIAEKDVIKKQKILGELNDTIFDRTAIFASPSIFEIVVSQPEYFRIHDIPLIRIEKAIIKYALIKRILDFFFSLCAIIVLFPVLVCIFILIKITSPGPSIFKQKRVGYLQKPFNIYKFRTMHAGAEAVVYQAKKKDSRITRLGGFLRSSRLDELPQLFNIFKGDMSFVGPRPLVDKEVHEGLRGTPGYAQRFSALPGVTGLAQVHGDYHTLPEYKIKYDLWYIYHYSLWLELSIIFRTAQTVFLRKGT